MYVYVYMCVCVCIYIYIYQATRTYSGTGSVTGSPRLASTFPAPEEGRCAPYCDLRQWARDLDPYVLPRAQFGGHILLPPVPMCVRVC